MQVFFFEKQTHTKERKIGFNTKVHHKFKLIGDYCSFVFGTMICCLNGIYAIIYIVLEYVCFKHLNYTCVPH